MDADLGKYSDLVEAAKMQAELWPVVRPGEATRRAVLEMLGYDPHPSRPREARIDVR